MTCHAVHAQYMLCSVLFVSFLHSSFISALALLALYNEEPLTLAILPSTTYRATLRLMAPRFWQFVLVIQVRQSILHLATLRDFLRILQRNSSGYVSFL